MEIEKRVVELTDRLNYIKDIFGGRENANIALMQARLAEFSSREAAAAAWEAFRADPEWVKVKTATETDGPLHNGVVSQYMEATDFSAIK